MLDRLFHRGFLGDDASGAAVGVVAGATLRLLGAVGDLPAIPRRGFELPLGLDLPLCRAARLGAPVLLADRTSMEAASPWLTAFAPTAASAICAPIRDDTGVIGSFGITFGITAAHPWHDDVVLRMRLVEIGLLLGRTVGRSGGSPQT